MSVLKTFEIVLELVLNYFWLKVTIVSVHDARLLLWIIQCEEI